MLVHHTDSQSMRILWRADRNFFSIYQNMSLIRIVNSIDHIHQRGFSASVLSQDRKDLGFSESEIHMVICQNGTEIAW